eukprot:gene7177-biopygen4660
MLPADVTQYGGIMKDLPFPLFPPEVCRLTNEKVFSAYSAPLYGGAAQKDPRTRLEKLYRNPREEQHVLRGGAMDPVYDGSGRQTAAIDSSEVKTMIASMQRELSELRSQLMAEKEKQRHEFFPDGPHGRGRVPEDLVAKTAHSAMG